MNLTFNNGLQQEDTIEEELSIKDLLFRQQAAKNQLAIIKSQLYARNNAIKNSSTPKTPFRIKVHDDQMQTDRGERSSCRQPFNTNLSCTLKRELKISSILNSERTERSIIRESESSGKRVKTGLSLMSREKKSKEKSILKTQQSHRTPQRQKLSNKPIGNAIGIKQFEKENEPIENPLKQILKIKQPEFHINHPLQGSSTKPNGLYLSKLIAQKAFQHKQQPFMNQR